MFVLVWNRGRRTTKKREPICLGAAGSGSISRMWKCISGAFHLMMMVIVQEKGHTYITCQWNGWSGMWSEERFLCFLGKCFLGSDKLFYDSLWREYCYLLKTKEEWAEGIVVKAWGAQEGPGLEASCWNYYVKSRARLFLQFFLWSLARRTIVLVREWIGIIWDLSKYFKQEMVNVIITTRGLWWIIIFLSSRKECFLLTIERGNF